MMRRRRVESCTRAAPACITLAPRPGVSPSPKPPVRIFLGTEPAQHRAERIFVWSVEKTRDPSRRYEIHLMKELQGFDSRRWTTGFTNYRFAIPHFAGGRGTAIYNDVDQIYLCDPAELFDRDLGAHGYLAAAPNDSSVLLIDCARMREIWTLDGARHEHKNALQRAARGAPGLGGAMDPAWNTRDDERSPEAAKLIHYTTLHTQPWRPFPERFVYQPNPVGGIWHDLERSADEAGFEVFSRERPSDRYAGWLERLAEAEIAGARDAYAAPRPGTLPEDPVDERVCETWIDSVPAEDLPWVLRDLCASARSRVTLRTAWSGRRRDAVAWEERLRAASRGRAGLHWELDLRAPDGRRERRRGGKRQEPSLPTVWVLADDRPGNATQSIGLAESLCWPYQVKRLECGRASMLHNRLLGASDLGIDRDRSSPLEAPWPDLVIAAGRRTAPVAQWIRSRSGGRTRLVALGRKAADAADLSDLSVTPSYARLFPHPRRLEIAAPLHRIDEAALEKAADEWADRLGDAPGLRIALLVGGTSGQYRMAPATARRLGADVARLARACGGSVLATTSRRLSPKATEALCEALAGAHFVHRWSAASNANPYLGLLAHADAFVITGDSESMLAEATSLGKPVAVYPLPVRASFRALSIAREWAWRNAVAEPPGPRGTPRPQRGLERLCARWIERGWVRPSRDLDRLHQALFSRGVARPFDSGISLEISGEPLRDRERVAAAVRDLMGTDDPADSSS